MSTSAKLILLLTVTVGLVMAVGGYFMVRQREAILITAMRNELGAHALTLQIALEDSYRGAARRLTLREVEREYILETLGATGGNKSRAVELLGLDRKTL